MVILAIESSCDETSAAIVSENKILSNEISSQYFHNKWGGVVPELASRAHLQYISEIVKNSLLSAEITIDNIDALAVTSQPGLVGSLIVGSNFAKGLAIKYNIPVIPVNHIEGHIYSGCINNAPVEFPFISLVISGGHTALFYVESYNNYKILGLTVDDAAGEAFDKTAKMLGLPYPGGPEIDRLATKGNSSAYYFPRSMISANNYNFSFSGLKTAVRYFLAKKFSGRVPKDLIPDIAASVQEAIVDVLVHKTVKAANEYLVRDFVASGGVSANSRLRVKMQEAAMNNNICFFAPEMIYCMDNAAMIGFLAQKKLQSTSLQDFSGLNFQVNPTSLRAKKE